MRRLVRKYFAVTAVFIGCVYSLPLHAQTITLGSLLDEMVDAERLTRLPAHPYRLFHASSYDRLAVQPHTLAWSSNADWGQQNGTNYFRIETIDGRTEYVFLDVAGPGAIVRFWATFWDDTSMILRVYLDQSSTPAIEGSLTQIIGRSGLVNRPLSFVAPDKAGLGVGHNLYLPIPFAHHCKITVERPSFRLYYNIDYRIYDAPAPLETFATNSLTLYGASYTSTLSALSNSHPSVVSGTTPQLLTGHLNINGGTQHIHLTGPGAIRLLTFQLSASDLMQALRSTHLEMDFDGETNAVHCPIGDFFGMGGYVTNGCTWFTEVKTNNSMQAFWVMPFEQSATVRLVNHGRQPVDVVQGEIRSGAYQWLTNSMHFHASWRDYLFEDSNLSPLGWIGEDLNYITLEGTGRLVGDSLSIFNDAGSDIPLGYENWWGEGDEKIYVDGETFPSHFGTGTEDYYGYAWCLPDIFNTPFIAQPVGYGNSRTGKAINTRMRLLDDLPYRSNLVFDMELMAWKAGRHRFAPTVFWYALPGGTCTTPDPLAASQLPVAQTTSGIEQATNTCPIGIRLEFDRMTITQNTGGATSITTTNGWGLSQEKCLFWMSCTNGASLTFEFQASFTGECTLVSKMIGLPASGNMAIRLNGASITTNTSLQAEAGHPISLSTGIKRINKGSNLLRFEVVGLPSGQSSADFVFDYLENTGPFYVSLLWPWTEVGTIIFLGL